MGSPESTLINDIKSELLDTTADHRKKAFGHDILVIDPKHPETSVRFNPLDDVAADIDAGNPSALSRARGIALQLAPDPTPPYPYTSFKIYTTYDALKLDDRQILDVLALARREGAMTMIHAENSDCIAWLTEQLELAGKTAPRFHADARPAIAEREATHRAISLAEIVGRRMLVVHVSGQDAISPVTLPLSISLRLA